MLRIVLRRFAGSAKEALEIQGNWAQQAQHENGYFRARFIKNILVFSVV
jgi:hypothetical protein